MKLKTTELRLGNLIKGIYTNENFCDNDNTFIEELKETTCEVVGLDSDIDYPIWVKSNEGITDFDYFEPLPLTEEWLLTFGFESTEYKWFETSYFTDIKLVVEKIIISYNIESGRLSIYDDAEDGLYPVYTAKKVEHVHQLQNLYYALTHQELTLKQ